MLRTLLFLAALGAGAALAPMGMASPDAAGEAAEEPSALPAGNGQEETFYACTACHGTAIIRRSHFSREEWDGLMDWMTERHAMPPLEGEERTLIVNYLAQHFGPRAPSRGRNPFLN
jgi:mono/diheme cytochrome c family protein